MLTGFAWMIAVWGVLLAFCVGVITLDEKGRKDK